MVLGVGKGVLFREVSVQECLHREREVPLFEDHIMCCPET